MTMFGGRSVQKVPSAVTYFSPHPVILFTISKAVWFSKNDSFKRNSRRGWLQAIFKFQVNISRPRQETMEQAFKNQPCRARTRKTAVKTMDVLEDDISAQRISRATKIFQWRELTLLAEHQQSTCASLSGGISSHYAEAEPRRGGGTITLALNMPFLGPS